MDKNQEKAVIAFKKARSHIEKIIGMIEEGEYCIDIMQQNLAVMGLLKSAHQTLLDGHLNTCFSNAMKSPNVSRQKKMIEEIQQVTKLYNK